MDKNKQNLIDVLVVLQARTSSSGLPAKVLLPIGGYPLAVLAAKRARNTGLRTIVVTSNTPDDDNLFNSLKKHDIDVHRGSLENVLQRFVDATKFLKDRTIIVRLTGDNVFPDGQLIEKLINHYRKTDVVYLCTNGLNSRIPCGLSAEVSLLKFFREANENCTNNFEREHVTPYIKNKYGINVYDKFDFKSYANLRCTIDNFDDYIILSKVFSKFTDPINTPIISLIKELAINEANLSYSESCDRLVLGGAQLGMKYGINNSIGQMQKKEAKDLIKFCIKSGVSYIDTARDYGVSEEIIGEILASGWREQIKIITKFNLPDSQGVKYRKRELGLLLDNVILKSCNKLNTQFIDVILFHKMDDFSANPYFFLEYFSKKISEGIVNSLGVSVQSPEELIEVLRYPELSFIQLPFNLLDTRWVNCIPKIKSEKRVRKLTIHCRSTLLQGLVVSTNPNLWSQAKVRNYKSFLDWLEMQRLKNKCETVSELALRYVLSFNWIDAIVVGFDSKIQASESIKYVLKGSLSNENLDYIQTSRPTFPFDSLNPSSWSKK